MRPKPMRLVDSNGEGPYLRDEASGLVWHRTELRVLYADTDCSGAVYHSNHLRYFEQGRTTLMRYIKHPYSAVEQAGFVYPVVNTGVNYYEALTYDDLVWVLTRPGELERVKIRFDYVILRQKNPRPAADGFTVHCTLNQKRIPVPVDEHTLQTWRSFPK